MAKGKKKKKEDDGDGAGAGGNCHPAELQLLLQLLPLLRSGSPVLQQLLSAGQDPMNGVASSSRPRAAMERKEDAPAASSAGKGNGQSAASSTEPLKKKADGWRTVPPKSQAKDSAGTTHAQKDKLLPEEWSVPARDGVSSLKVDEPSVCLATKAETERVLAEVKAKVPCAVLCALQVSPSATEMKVLVTDGTGKEQVRKRFLHQLGPMPVVYNCSAVVGSEVAEKGVLVAVTLSARHSAEAKWTEALKRPKQLVASWLKEVAGVEEPMAIGDPAISQGNVLTARVMVRTLDRDKCLRASGKGEGVFCRPWRTKGQMEVLRRTENSKMCPSTASKASTELCGRSRERAVLHGAWYPLARATPPESKLPITQPRWTDCKALPTTAGSQMPATKSVGFPCLGANWRWQRSLRGSGR